MKACKHDDIPEVCKDCEIEALKAENKRLDMCLFSNTEPSQSYKNLEADLKDAEDAEDAVDDLMTLNDTLTGEMEALKKCDATGYDRFEAGKSFSNRLLKAEVERLTHDSKKFYHANGSWGVYPTAGEVIGKRIYAAKQVERLREALKIIFDNSINPDHTITMLGLTEVTDANFKIANEALNHKEG